MSYSLFFPSFQTKTWVQEEWSKALVAKIEGRSRLIPIKIEQCNIPVSLSDLVRKEIRDIASWDAEFKDILDDVYGRHSAPPLGTPPLYAQSTLPQITGLSQIDVIVLKQIYDRHLKWKQIFVISYVSGMAEELDVDISKDAYNDSIEILGGLNLLNVTNGIDAKPIMFQPTFQGLKLYAAYFLPNFESDKQRVYSYLANAFAVTPHAPTSASAIKDATGVNEIIVTSLLSELHSSGLAGVAFGLQFTEVITLSAAFKRMVS